uniref:BHLH domain-containing protein n=1 Tax=Pelusios castaneus TaxID=367368 RepID=A0A8C8S2Q1_9SAUR
KSQGSQVVLNFPPSMSTDQEGDLLRVAGGCFNSTYALSKNGENARPEGAVNLQHLSQEEKQWRWRTTQNYHSAHATRDRSRLEAFNMAYGELRQLLPTLPPNKKLSKIEVLRLAICYISYLNHVLHV